MTTATAKPKPTARPEPAKKKLLGTDPVKHYRKMILAGDVPTADEILAAGCFSDDAETDAATLASRTAAAAVLASMPTNFQAAKKHRLTTKDYGAVPVPGTIAELAVALEKFVQRRDRPHEANADDFAAADKARNERYKQQDAAEVLLRTASPDLALTQSGARKAKQELGRAIAGRRKIKPILAEIKQTEEEQKGIFGRKRQPGDDKLLADVEHRLANLRSDAEIAEYDARADANNEAEIDKIQAKIDEAQLARMIPSNLRWASEIEVTR